MNSDITTTSSSSMKARSRDVSAHRRAHLDTYAKRRAGITEEVELKNAQQQLAASLLQDIRAQQPTPAAVAQNEQSIQPVQVTQPQAPVVANKFTLPEEELVVESQPPVVGDVFAYVPQEVEAPAPTQTIQEVKPVDQTSYLDTLTKRHHEAVALAPAAEETVFHPTAPLQTETLFDDPDADQRIEANLGALYGDYSLTSQLSKSTNSVSASHVRTIVASAFACGVMAVGIFGLLGRYSSQPVVAQPIDSPVIEVDASNVTLPTASKSAATLGDIPQADPSYPVRMLVSGIGVNAPMQNLGMTADGLIDVPKSYGLVGWYNKSSVPGTPGPAVLVGHYTGGNGGVFDKLKDVNNGDLITVTNGKGQTFTYKVSAKNEYDKDAVPMAELFKKSNDSRLEIITCSGKWQSSNYNKRLVVTAELVK